MRLIRTVALCIALGLLPVAAEQINVTPSGGGGAPTGAAGGSLTGTFPNPGLNLGGTNTGVLPAVNGGTGEAGTITGALKGNGTGAATQAACADLSNATGLCSATYTSSGSWTPVDASGASLVFTGVSAKYTQIGNMVFAYAELTYPSTVDATTASIGGLPVAVPAQEYARQCTVTRSSLAGGMQMLPFGSAVGPKSIAGANLANSALSLVIMNFNCIYPAS